MIHCIHSLWSSFGRVILPVSLLLLGGRSLGQSRVLVDVTPGQLADLPALTNGAQAWGDYDNDGRAEALK